MRDGRVFSTPFFFLFDRPGIHLKPSKCQVLVHVMNLLIHFLSPGDSEDHRMSREKTKNSRWLSWSLMSEETGLSIFPEDARDPVIIL